NSPPQVTVHSGGFWAAAATSGHHLGWHRSQKNRAILLFPSRPIPATERPVLAGKCKNPIEFNPKFKELDPLLRPPFLAIKLVQEYKRV
ncbi:AP2/B3-like transcriptional factor family protein, partial [Prunus dulcis]